MKLVKKIFDLQRRHFTKGGKFERLEPIFDATETFFFIPGETTRHDTHIRDTLDVKRYMVFVIIALIPPSLYGIYNAGYQSNLASGLSMDFVSVVSQGLYIVIPIIFVSYAVGFFWEFLFAVIRKHPISEGLLVSGLLFPLTLPPSIPLWQVAVGISFGIVIGKEIFGGTGRNILNPALTARAFLFFAYPANMSGDKVWNVVSQGGEKIVDAVSGATPLALSNLAEAGTNIEAALEGAGYSFFRLFMGSYLGSIGATSVLASLIGAVLLIFLGIASYRIIFGCVLGLLFTGFFLNLFASSTGLAWLSLNPFYHLVMGGFAFGAVYMATDPVSAPGMDRSRWVYGFMIGALTVLIRVFNPAYPEGVMLAILFMNLFSSLLDHFVIKFRISKRIPHV